MTDVNEHDAAMLPRVDLALVKEVQDLRAENEQLHREKSKMRAALQMTIDSIEDKRNKVEMSPALYGALTHIVLEVNRVLDEV